ncbi:hypothetical protein LCI18_000111 [Fusarium solani-melongenae]|uniref:Uncharacterized protein n=1 Tax=Fusarium solani subsp. cucurbitae TaxID=2747967 RepID=A0ACD3YJZ7_FUSSC|nr:hypothetical protein LCI18_000111 [Fusarium solani-melongenae]
MVSTTHINLSRMGAADLCDECLVVLLDDSVEEFYEGKMSKNDDTPTLRHVHEVQYRELYSFYHTYDEDEDEYEDEDESEGDASPYMDGLFIAGVPSRRWKDELPGLPAMAKAAEVGCLLCQFLRQAILRKRVSYEGPIQVLAGYIWGANRSWVEQRDDGLVAWRCEVLDGRGYLLSAIDFNVETRNGKLSPGGIVTWLRMDGKRSPTPLGVHNVEWMKDTLGQCEEKCNHIEAGTDFLPTRLIDVGTETGDDARLMRTADSSDQGLKYAALSYCWGPKEDAAKQTKTTRSNLSQHLQGMPLRDMVPVVRDAILVCKALNIQYLWVDALCILQDDSDDWDKESQIMGHIFYFSFLTICPLSSNSCLEGFLRPRPPGLEIEFQSSRRKSIRGTYTLFERRSTLENLGIDLKYCQDLDRDQSSWVTRGWTLQEDLMSLRILFFGTSMCHFSCKGLDRSENGHHSSVRASDVTARDIMSWSLKPQGRLSHAQRGELHDRWGETYRITQRKRTYREDILPAISGLAKQYAALTNEAYFAGLWENTLHYDLLWRIRIPHPGDLEKTLQRIRNQRPYIAPSWSWSSQQKPVETLRVRTYNASKRPGVIITPNPPLPSHSRSEFILEEINMDSWGKNPFGQLKGGSIKVSGKVAPFPSDVLMKPCHRGRPALGYFANNYGTCHWDWSSEVSTVQQPGKMRLLLLLSCCAATIDWDPLIWNANPEENHKEIHSAFVERNPLCRTIWKDYVGSEDCRCCKDENLPRNAWGIVIHPAEEPDSFYRVGAFTLLAYSGGTDVFKNVASQTIKLV